MARRERLGVRHRSRFVDACIVNCLPGYGSTCEPTLSTGTGDRSRVMSWTPTSIVEKLAFQTEYVYSRYRLGNCPRRLIYHSPTLAEITAESNRRPHFVSLAQVLILIINETLDVCEASTAVNNAHDDQSEIPARVR